jgi:hypothetical protein
MISPKQKKRQRDKSKTEIQRPGLSLEPDSYLESLTDRIKKEVIENINRDLERFLAPIEIQVSSYVIEGPLTLNEIQVGEMKMRIPADASVIYPHEQAAEIEQELRAFLHRTIRNELLLKSWEISKKFNRGGRGHGALRKLIQKAIKGMNPKAPVAAIWRACRSDPKAAKAGLEFYGEPGDPNAHVIHDQKSSDMLTTTGYRRFQNLVSEIRKAEKSRNAEPVK